MEYDIQELAGGISMDAVLLRVEKGLMWVGADPGKCNATIKMDSDAVEAGDDIIIKNSLGSITIRQSTFNRLVDSGDIEVYVRNS